jgi:hypothetical protein
VFNLLLLLCTLQVAANPFLPRLNPLLAQTPLGFIYPDKIRLPEDVLSLPYIEQVLTAILDHADRDAFLSLLRKCSLLLGLGWFGGLFKRLLPSSVTSDFSHLRVSSGLSSPVRRYTRLMLVATMLFFGLTVAPKVLSHPHFSSTPFVPYVFLVASLNSLSVASESAYGTYASFDSYFVPRALVASKASCDLFLRPLAASQEAVLMVYGLFLPAPAYHYVTWEKLLASAAVLFYYLPAPWLLFGDGWEERGGIYDKYGDLTERRRREIEEMVTRADPAFKKFEKKFRKKQIEAKKARRLKEE